MEQPLNIENLRSSSRKNQSLLFKDIEKCRKRPVISVHVLNILVTDGSLIVNWFNLCLESVIGSKHFAYRIARYLVIFRDSVWSVLTGSGASDNTPSLVMHEVRELETWILRLLSTPVPMPGVSRVEVSTAAQLCPIHFTSICALIVNVVKSC